MNCADGRQWTRSMKIPLLAGLLMVGACTSAAPRHAKFNRQESTPYAGTGTGEISRRVWVFQEGFRGPERVVAGNATVTR